MTRLSIERIHELATQISIQKWRLLQKKVTPKNYEAYPNILCIFQTFNKSHLIRFVLHPFVRRGFKNIILFADGCIDNTLNKAKSILRGSQHYVMEPLQNPRNI